MNKKQLNTNTITNELENASLYFARTTSPARRNEIQKEPVRSRQMDKERGIIDTPVRKTSRDTSSDPSREKSREIPTRDEIQEFSFRLRDTLKVKVQAEVPYQWQDELEETARQLKVKKLELYRYILGQFLGKTKRKQGT